NRGCVFGVSYITSANMLPAGPGCSAAPPTSPFPEPKISQPNKFDGDWDKFQWFLNQCWLLFLLCPQSFPMDQAYVGLILSLLTGEALAWASPFLSWNSPAPSCNN
uniref:DUF4939 domain-containing protein n=1 Tax=Chrysemys picta bellii TaxID=8478 RepID=A0A8C3FDM0_CHRPI